jgi:hypothetical protein
MRGTRLGERESSLCGSSTMGCRRYRRRWADLQSSASGGWDSDSAGVLVLLHLASKPGYPGQLARLRVGVYCAASRALRHHLTVLIMLTPSTVPLYRSNAVRPSASFTLRSMSFLASRSLATRILPAKSQYREVVSSLMPRPTLCAATKAQTSMSGE